VAEVAEHLPTKHKFLGMNFSTVKKYIPPKKKQNTKFQNVKQSEKNIKDRKEGQESMA
jgi:hypothetical protein